MPNPLTGDFDAVLQISGSTLDRLMASMHQNAFENPKLPSFPHSVRMRIGDDHAYEGVRGLAHAQVSVPQIKLIHGATDRFMLEVWVRAWYRPDPGTEPLPAYINGMVRAEYRLQDIDPSCPGFSKNAADFLWFRVVRDSVQFRGTAVDDVGFGDMVAIPSGDPEAIEAANIAKVTRQIARLLAKRFEATPHPVSKRFRRGSLRSLNNQGGSAIALPLGLNGDPWGNIHSVDNVLLNGTDLAVGVNVNYLMSVAQKARAAVRQFRTDGRRAYRHAVAGPRHRYGLSCWRPPASRRVDPAWHLRGVQDQDQGLGEHHSCPAQCDFRHRAGYRSEFRRRQPLAVAGVIEGHGPCQRHLHRHHGQHREGQGS